MTAGTAAHAARIAAAFVAACRDELDAPKPGNVHVFADGHRMTAAEFETFVQNEIVLNAELVRKLGLKTE